MSAPEQVGDSVQPETEEVAMVIVPPCASKLKVRKHVLNVQKQPNLPEISNSYSFSLHTMHIRYLSTAGETFGFYKKKSQLVDLVGFSN